MNWIQRFLEESKPLQYLNTAVQADAETVERTRARQEAAREALGTKWIGHYRHARTVSRARFLSDWDEALIEQASRTVSAAMVLRLHRRDRA